MSGPIVGKWGETTYLTRTHTVVEVEFVEPVYTAPEEDGPASVCLQSNIETKTELNIMVTASEKSPVEAQGSSCLR